MERSVGSAGGVVAVHWLPNMRLKLPAPVLEGRIAFVHFTVWRRSLSAIR